jgi:hypothetical protein
MSIFSLLPNYSGRRRLPELLALAQVLFLGIGCATVAGFEDFTAKGTGGYGSNLGGAVSNGGASFIVPAAGSNSGGGTTPSVTGGAGAFPSTGGSVARATGGLPGTGGASGCGQVQQACCSGATCGAGLECYGGTCRTCGSDRQSCCNNGATSPCVTGAGCCITGAVCVSSSSTQLQSVCSISCGALGLPCCTGGSFTGTGCAEGTALVCRAGTCLN